MQDHRDLGNLFVLQNEITSRIAIALNPKLIDAEAARRTDRPEALDYIFRGRAATSKPFSRDSYAEAISLYERALRLDPRSVEAQSALATTLAARVLDGRTDTAAADIARAEALIRRALAASPLDLLPHFAKGLVLRVQGRPDEGAPSPRHIGVVGLRRNRALPLTSLSVHLPTLDTEAVDCLVSEGLAAIGLGH